MLIFEHVEVFFIYLRIYISAVFTFILQGATYDQGWQLDSVVLNEQVTLFQSLPLSAVAGKKREGGWGRIFAN